MIYYSIIIVLVCAIMLIVVTGKTERGLGIFVGVSLGIMILWSIAIGIHIGEKIIKDAVKERLVKDKKNEWKVSNDGQPYLILRDSSLSETWKYLK